jgi:hypothetical protein
MLGAVANAIPSVLEHKVHVVVWPKESTMSSAARIETAVADFSGNANLDKSLTLQLEIYLNRLHGDPSWTAEEIRVVELQCRKSVGMAK